MKKVYKRNYPKTVEEILDDNIQYKESTHDAMVRFRKLKPWRGDMKKKIAILNKDLALSYDIEQPQVVFVKQFAYGSCYFPVGNLIILEQERDGRYSVVTFLHEFGHALGKDERETCRWSINLFRYHFPKSFARLKPCGHLLMKDDVNVFDKQ